MRPDRKFRQGFIGVPTAVAIKISKFPLLAPQGGISWFPYRVGEVEYVQGLGWEGCARWFATHLMVLSAGGMHSF